MKQKIIKILKDSIFKKYNLKVDNIKISNPPK
jgi:hypothetical protein